MNTYANKFVDGHVIININNFDYILDTGSPSSFGRGTNITINDKHFPITSSSLTGFTIDSLNNVSGLKFDGLIGVDILNHFDIRFTRTQVTFSNTPLSYDDSAIILPIIETLMGIPIITLNIANKDERIFFDSGAKISYLDDDLLVGTSVGVMDDFYPTLGTFKTNVYKIDVNINGNIQTLTFGSLPSSLRMAFTIGRVKGIIGTELLNKYSLILSNSRKMLILEPLDDEESFVQDETSDKDQHLSKNKMNLVREPSLD